MADNIIIDFQVNTSELTDTINILEKLGQIDKKTADEFRAANKTYGERVIITKQVDKETNKLTDDTSKLGKETVSSVNKSKQSISSMDSVLKSVGSAIAGAFAVQKIIAFGEASVKAFQEAERNALLLKSAVSVNGGLQQDFEDLIAQSAELQKVTIFSDDAIQQAQTAALQFGLTKDQVKALIPVITDFASATGQDLQTALDGVIQGINGVGRGLKIYGVTIDENGTRQSRLAEITDQLTKKFDGQAKAVGETASGAAAKYANEIDNLQESLGERLAPVLNTIRGTVLETTQALLESAGLLQDIGFDDVFKRYKDLFKEKFATTGLDELRLKYTELVKIQDKVSGESRTVVLAQKQAIIELLNSANGLTKVSKEESDALEKLGRVSKLTDKELQELKKTFDKFNDIGAKDAADVIDKEFEKRAKERGKKKSDVEDKADKERLDALKQQIKKNEDEANKALDIELSNLETAKQNEIALEERSAAEKLLIDKKYLEEKLKYYEDDPVMQAKIGAEIATVNAKINEQAIEDKKATDDAIIKQNNDKNQAILDADEAAAKKQQEYQQALYEGIVNAVKETVSLISEAMNNYYNAQAERIQKEKEDMLNAYDEQIEANENKHDRNKIGDRDYENNKKKLLDERKKAEERADKELRRIKHEQAVYNKALAIADAIINTAVAVTANLAVPIVAALIAVLGAAEVAVIASQPIPKYAKGVERVPGVGTDTSDNITALLSPGERVVSAERNRKYFPILSAIHNERFSPNELNEIAKLSPAQLKSFSLPSLKVNQSTNYRTDLSPAIINNSNQVTSQFGLDEHGVRRALDGGTSIKERSADYLAKSIARELSNNRPSFRKSWT